MATPPQIKVYQQKIRPAQYATIIVHVGAAEATTESLLEPLGATIDSKALIIGKSETKKEVCCGPAGASRVIPSFVRGDGPFLVEMVLLYSLIKNLLVECRAFLLCILSTEIGYRGRALLSSWLVNSNCKLVPL